MQAAPGSRVALRRLLGSCPALHRKRFVGVPLSAGAPLRAPQSGQVRHVGRRRRPIDEEEGVEEFSRLSDVEAPPRKDEEGAESGYALPEVPADILDAWEKDEMAREALGMFSSEELQGKGLMSHRDVARMLELMGCDRLTFLRMMSAEGDDDEDIDKGGSIKGKGTKGGKGYAFDDGEPWAARAGGGGGGGGKKGLKGSEDRLDFDDSDDEDDFGKGGGKKGYKGSKGRSGGFQRRDDSDDEDDFGKGGGKKGYKGSKGKSGGFHRRDDSDDEDEFGKGGGKKGYKGSKGKSGGFQRRDDSDDEDFASPRGKGKGGKGGRKGKDKGGYSF